jgi:hypothetical protein
MIGENLTFHRYQSRSLIRYRNRYRLFQCQCHLFQFRYLKSTRYLNLLNRYPMFQYLFLLKFRYPSHLTFRFRYPMFPKYHCPRLKYLFLLYRFRYL